MFHIILHQPEIPPNTGNIIRLCANMGSTLHLIKPFGFTLDDRQLRRAGLDYHEWARVQSYENFEACLQQSTFNRIFACSTKGKTRYAAPCYEPGDAFLFGCETRGLPQTILNTFPEERIIRIPMQAESRSLNLSNAVAIIAYEAWRQNDFHI